MDTIMKKLGVSESAFAITAKVAEEEAAEKEVMEFGVESPMFLLLGTLGMLYLFCFASAIMRRLGMLLRKDKGMMPMSVTVKSVVLALSACTCIAFL
ncbi:hypothetical protein F2Q68_00043833 [Brassica cretica]|nr:hypothetical protein F2Q68_00043833 [Brassica cretica]KAF3519800.1 hypothetical protein DY000_02059716 [Brassica cretica]